MPIVDDDYARHETLDREQTAKLYDALCPPMSRTRDGYMVTHCPYFAVMAVIESGKLTGKLDATSIETLEDVLERIGAAHEVLMSEQK